MPLIGIILVCSGYAAFISRFFLLGSFIMIFSVTILLAYFSRHPLSGFIVGLYVAMTFLLGLLFFAITKWISGFDTKILLQYFSLYPPSGRLLSILSAVFALALLGLFSGLMGYVFKKFSLVYDESGPIIFRDYWSQILGFGKSENEEYPDYDRRLAGWSTLLGSLPKYIITKLQQAKQELIFKTKDGATNGELYNTSSNNKIGEFYNFHSLITQYRPRLLHFVSGLTDLFPIGHFPEKPPLFGDKISNLVNSISSSRKVIWLSLGFFFFINIGTTAYMVGNRYDGQSILITLFAIGIPSFITCLFIYWFWKRSKSIVSARSDENGLVFAIYLCLFLVYPIIFLNLLYQPTLFSYWIPSDWALQWFMAWTVPFLILSTIVGMGYVSIHREAENANVYFFDNSEQPDPELKPLKKNEKIPWLASDRENGTLYYWVIRFTYYWPLEFTVPKSHEDWERVEVWFDAKTGKMKWVVSDYHYREVWYRVKNPDLSYLYVEILPNFHTPVPMLDSDMVYETQNLLNNLGLTKQKRNQQFESVFIVSLFSKLFIRLKNLNRKVLKKLLKKSFSSRELKDDDPVNLFLKKLGCDKVRYADGVNCKDSDSLPLYLSIPACDKKKGKCKESQSEIQSN